MNEQICRHGFMRTVEAVFAGVIIFIFFSTLSLQAPEISGLDAKKVREVSSLLAVATVSNASAVLINADETSSSELLRNMLADYMKIDFELRDIPKKDIRIGFWIDDVFERTTTQNEDCAQCPGLTGSCGTFLLDSQTACFNNRNYIYFDYSGDRDYGDEKPILLHQIFTPPGSENRYSWSNYRVLASDYILSFMNLSEMYGVTQLITNEFILNGRKSTIYFIPIHNHSDVFGIDAILILNRTRFSPEEIEMLSGFMRDGNGLVWISDISDPADAQNMLNLLGLRWVSSDVSGTDSSVITNPRLLESYTPTYNFAVYLNSSLYGVQTVPITSSKVPEDLDASCIPNWDTSRYGVFELNRKRYPFLLVRDTDSYSSLYVDYDGDNTFCEVPDEIRIKLGSWFNVTRDRWILFADADRELGTRFYFSLNISYEYHDFTNVGLGTAGINRVYPTTNESAYVPLILNSKTYTVDGLTKNVAALVLNAVNYTSRIAWMPSSLAGNDEWKIVRDVLVWVSRQKSFEYGKFMKYSDEVMYPVLWRGNATLLGEVVVKIW